MGNKLFVILRGETMYYWICLMQKYNRAKLHICLSVEYDLAVVCHSPNFVDVCPTTYLEFAIDFVGGVDSSRNYVDR